ncbi:hypothetical protein C8Q75DRAFT_22439 [Abortiporus biennis]|nr:hypothetical protein C8Q75DRAFT_22439 [Abortiporus biennis]
MTSIFKQSSSERSRQSQVSEPQRKLASFVSEDPESRYTFDSNRDSQESEICREGKKLSRKCIKLQMHSTKMFQAMQTDLLF